MKSGLRAVEVARILANRLRFVDKEEFIRFELNWKKGLREHIGILYRVSGYFDKLDLKSLEEVRSSLGLTGFKYVRKFVATKLVEMGSLPLHYLNYK